MKKNQINYKSKLFFFLFLVCNVAFLSAQDTIYFHQINGDFIVIPTSEIDSIIFYDASMEIPPPEIQLPEITTSEVTSVTQTTATSGGNILSDGGAEITQRGICWSIEVNTDTTDYKTFDGTGAGSFISNLTGLTANTTYYIRAYAVNAAGVAYGEEKTFTTQEEPKAPVITTEDIYCASQIMATGGGNVISDGGSDVFARGVCWNTSGSPTVSDDKTTNGSNIGSFTSGIAGLSAGTKYYVRAYATNIIGTTYGDEKSFTTLLTTQVADIDGNIYNIVFENSTYKWFKENLKTTRYNDGTPIPLVTDIDAWKNLATPAYCWYNNDETTFKNPNGALYNWYTVNTGKLCPTGWRVPSEKEWQYLTAVLANTGHGYGGSGSDIAKSMASASGWAYSDIEGTPGNNPSINNNTGYTGVAAGVRTSSGTFGNLNKYAVWWRTDNKSTYGALYEAISYIKSNVFSEEGNKSTGLSVRCVRDINGN